MRGTEESHNMELPIEIWVYIFSYLEAESLLRCQGVCRSWREEVSHMIFSGKIPRLGLRCQRLAWKKDILNEYRKNTWESLSVCADRPVLLVGVGVYAPSGETTICVDARPLEENLREIDVSTELDSFYEEEDKIITLFGKPQSAKPFRFRLEAGQWWEIVLNIRPGQNGGTLGGRTVWCGGGVGGMEEVRSHGVVFSFRQTVRSGWRSEYTQGQFPVLYFWRL